MRGHQPTANQPSRTTDFPCKNNLGLFLTKRAFLSPHHDAYVDSHSGLRLNYDELNRRCNQVANAFVAAGIQKEERVGLLLMNSAEFMESYFALAKIGAVIVPLNWRLVADELEFILKDSGTKRLIYGDEFVDTVAELHSRGDKTDISHWLQVEGEQETAYFAQSYEAFRNAASDAEPAVGGIDDDMLYIMYTSGTTGLPKGVVHTHNTAIWGIITIAANVHYREQERYLAALPMFHVGALTPLAVNVYRGAASVVMRAFDPTLAWQLIEREKVTSALMVPAMMNFMLQVPNYERYDFSALRWVMTGAAPVPVALIQRYSELGVDVRQVYGLTETCGPGLPDGRPRPRSKNRPQPAPPSSTPPCGWRTKTATTAHPASPGRCSWPAPTSCANTGIAPRRRRRPSWTAGCAPAMWRPWTRTATSSFRTASRT